MKTIQRSSLCERGGTIADLYALESIYRAPSLFPMIVRGEVIGFAGVRQQE